MGDTILQVDDIQKFYGNKGNLTKAMVAGIILVAIIVHVAQKNKK